jgi:hypothetical protein
MWNTGWRCASARKAARSLLAAAVKAGGTKRTSRNLRRKVCRTGAAVSGSTSIRWTCRRRRKRTHDRGVAIRVWTDELVYKPMQKSIIHIELEFAEGLHAYVDPVPPGFTALTVEIDERPGLVTFPIVMPKGSAFEIEGFDDEFMVIGGSTKLSLPFKVSGRRHETDGRNREMPLTDDVTVLTVDVRYQICSDRECFPPSNRRLAVPLVEAPLVAD